MLIRLVVALALVLLPQAVFGQVVAVRLAGSASQNLISHTNPWDGGFTSAGDGFQKFQRGVSPSIPFSVVDDSLVIFPADSLGIIKDGNTDVFFGVTDTVNADTSGPVIATWVFDISGASGSRVSIDMGAMGDFESSDVFELDLQYRRSAAATSIRKHGRRGRFPHLHPRRWSEASRSTIRCSCRERSSPTTCRHFVAPIAGTGAQLTLTLTA